MKISETNNKSKSNYKTPKANSNLLDPHREISYLRNIGVIFVNNFALVTIKIIRRN